MFPLLVSIDSHGDGAGLIIACFVVLVISFAIVSYWMERRRREALQAIAVQLGFGFFPDKNPELADRYQFLNHMDSGSNRYAFNLITGTTHDGEECEIFDYHYETYSTGDKGKRETQHHYYAVFTLKLPRSFPEISIQPEGFLSKIAQALGFDDIDFESLEFSKRYQVKSADKKFAYDFCNARMIDYLLNSRDFTIEVDQDVLALTFNGRLNPESVISNYQSLVHIRSLLPNYLFES